MLSGLYINVAFVSFFFFLEYGRNGNIGLNQCGTKRHAHRAPMLGHTFVFSSYIYF